MDLLALAESFQIRLRLDYPASHDDGSLRLSGRWTQDPDGALSSTVHGTHRRRDLVANGATGRIRIAGNLLRMPLTGPEHLSLTLDYAHRHLEIATPPQRGSRDGDFTFPGRDTGPGVDDEVVLTIRLDKMGEVLGRGLLAALHKGAASYVGSAFRLLGGKDQP